MPGLSYAGFGRRLGGYLLDVLIYVIPIVILFFILSQTSIAPMYSTQEVNPFCNPARDYYCSTTTASYHVNNFGYLLISAAQFFYFGIFVAVWGRTPGQAIVGVRVASAQNPSANIPLERAILRGAIFWLGNILGMVSVALSLIWGLFFFVACLWVLWDPKKQGLHDKIGNAILVRLSPAFNAYPPMMYPGQPAPNAYPAPGYPMQPAPAPYGYGAQPYQPYSMQYGMPSPPAPPQIPTPPPAPQPPQQQGPPPLIPGF